MKLTFLKWSDSFYLGPLFIEWEPWFMRVGLTLFFWIVQLEFSGAFTKGAREMRRQMKAEGIWNNFGLPIVHIRSPRVRKEGGK